VATLLTVVRPGLPMPEPQAAETVIAFDEFAGWVRPVTVATRFRTFDQARMLVHRLESAGRPLPLSLALRWMTRGAVRIEDLRGKKVVLYFFTSPGGGN